MNKYVISDSLNGPSVFNGLKEAAFLGAVAIGSVLSDNFKTAYVPKIQDATTGDPLQFEHQFTFDLPFQIEGVDAMVTDTRHKTVQEIIDRPFVTRGSFVALHLKTGYTIDPRKDLGHYQEIKFYNSDGDSLIMGIANSTLTDSYAPFGVVNGILGPDILAMKIYDINALREVKQSSQFCHKYDVNGVNPSHLNGPNGELPNKRR